MNVISACNSPNKISV